MVHGWFGCCFFSTCIFFFLLPEGKGREGREGGEGGGGGREENAKGDRRREKEEKEKWRKEVGKEGPLARLSVGFGGSFKNCYHRLLNPIMGVVD